MKTKFAFTLLLVSVLMIQSCDKEEVTTCPEIPKTAITLKVNQLYNGSELEFHKTYTSDLQYDFWFTNSKFYLSNIVGVKSDGTKKLISEIALITFTPGSESVSVTGNIEQGDYTAVEFDLGVRQDLNSKDPSVYSTAHPLSVTNNMYWTWSTQYIFSRVEGFCVQGSDTTSFFIHAGTEDLYRPKVSVSRSFTVSQTEPQIEINLDMHSLLNQEEYVFDLVNDGQSHTMDNLPLAVHYMDNFSHAFN